MSSRVNLAPAIARKECSAYDLPFTIGILITIVPSNCPFTENPLWVLEWESRLIPGFGSKREGLLVRTG